MKKKGRIVGIGGGFHDVRYRGFRVSAEAYEALERGDKAEFLDRLSDEQRKKFYRHLCGVKNCYCHGRGWQWL